MKRKSHLLLFIFLLLGMIGAFAQESVTVTGMVVDENGKPMPSITVLGGSPLRALTSTDGGGRFRISVPTNSRIVFRSLGYRDNTVTVSASRDNLNVSMVLDESSLEEVVVRGYVARSKELTTGASFSINTEDLKDRPVGNVEVLLQGLAPGMNVQVNTGAPGFRGSTQIRGLSSISTTGVGNESFLQPTSPLYVIDGIPMDADRATEFGFQQQGPGISPLSMIPVEDIASIEILKDAQATSLYGSQAAYGVIIITTKRGNSPIPRVRYNHNSFVRTPPALRATLGGNLERAMKMQQILDNAPNEYERWRIAETEFLSDSLNAYWNNSTDWQSLYYRNTFNQNHNLAIDGGDQLFNYKANLGYFNEKGIIRNTGFSRYSANLRMEYQPESRKFQVIGAVNGSVGKQSVGDGVGMLQTGVASGGASSSLLPPPSFYQSSGGYMSSLRTDNDNATRLIRTHVEASYFVVEGLRLNSTMSYEYESKTEDTFTPAIANNQFARMYAYNGRNTQLYNRNSINYSKTFNDTHTIFVNTFNEFRIWGRHNSITRQERGPNDQFRGPIGFDGYNSRGGGVLSNFRDERAASFAVAGTYDYDKKYVVELAYRWDGSSGAGFDNLYAQNPSVGLKWNAHRESFLEGLLWLNMASARLSWGVNIVPEATLERIYGRYDITGNYNGQQGIGLNFDQVPNPALTPVTTTQYNLGLDINMFNNRFSLVYDTYYKIVDNMLFEQFLPNTTGFNKIFSNSAGIANYGHELYASFRPLAPSSPFDLHISVNGALNRDVLLRLPSHYGGQFIRFDDEEHRQHNVYRVGTATMSNYLRINDGVYSTDADVPVDPVTGLTYQTNGRFFEAGDPILRDLNGDYILDGDDYMRTGNTQPLLTGGAMATLNWKNFGFSIYGSFTAKRTILNNALAYRLALMSSPFDQKAVVPLDDIDMWRRPGDVAVYPYAYDYTRYGSIQPFRYDQNLWAEDGSYFKINSVVLSYQFDKRIANGLGLDNIRLNFSAESLHTFSRYKGPNPENVTSMGRDVSEGYPVPRSYSLGVNIGF